MSDTVFNRVSCLLSTGPGELGDFAIAAARLGHKRLSPEHDGKTVSVVAVSGVNWEIRSGCLYTHSSNTLGRGILVESSSGSAVALDASTVVTVVFTAAQASRVMLPGPQDFGAKCDLVLLMSPIIASGSNVLNSVDALFTSADIGKHIAITGAGPSVGTSVTPDAVTLYGPLVTTITGVNSSTQAVLGATATRSVGSGVGVQYVKDNAVLEGSAKAFYGTDDTAALQAYTDASHWGDGVVRIPNPGCMILGTIYVQRSNTTVMPTTVFRRLEFRGVGPCCRVTTTGLAQSCDSNLFKPTVGNILTVNIDSSGESMTATGSTLTGLFSCFAITNMAFNGMPGLQTLGFKCHATRADIEKTAFNNLALGWDALSNDAGGCENYCDQWRVDRINFNNCAALYWQKNADATEWRSIVAESHYPSVTTCIDIYGGRGWELRAPLINNLPESARIGYLHQCKEGTVSAGHFEHIWGKAFDVEGSNGNTWVDIRTCDFYHPLSGLGSGMTLDTIRYYGASGTVERCGFSQKRASGLDISFSAGGYQLERNNKFYEADNSTPRYPKTEIVIASGNNGTSFHQQYFVKVECYYEPADPGYRFSILNVNGGNAMFPAMNGQPSLTAGGFLNLDGNARWGRPTVAIPVQINGKYKPVITGVYILTIAFYNDAGVHVTTPDENMNCYLLIS
ncbi:hypothetical protein UFOVP1254_106 [uncultured Caudovirales phage]|uniref:Uncharacterized protein n=1 Tax=uncultured Caudovirales phage TaxID=2100421 RepID=A0A6J5RLP4_9CAUD|nr:hypothetical protein UFOVP1254_106 [uncultured Caudovirales phage]